MKKQEVKINGKIYIIKKDGQEWVAKEKHKRDVIYRGVTKPDNSMFYGKV